MKTFSVLIIAALAVVATARHHSVVWDETRGFSVMDGIVSSAMATGTFNDTIEEVGWAMLEINTNPAFDDYDTMYAAGYLEGATSATRIGQSWINFWASTFPKGAEPNLLEYINTTMAWTADQVAANVANFSEPSSSFEWQYWAQVGLLMRQFEGVVDGYASARSSDLPDIAAWQMFLLNSQGDTDDLIPAMAWQNKSEAERAKLDPIDLTPARLRQIMLGSHCSSIVKLTDDNVLHNAHEMWSTYSQMIEVYKHYNFKLNIESLNSWGISMSSYPAFVSSEDDFYLMTNGLAVMETTNSILNMSLYDAVQPDSLMSWIRVMVANRMAANGSDWATIFALHNSGTYNNQWMIVDYNKAPAGKTPQDGALWIASQIPGKVYPVDVTPVLLEQGYWASYNIPYVTAIWEIAGYPAAVEKFGDIWTHDKCPRANIFRRDQPMVNDMTALQALMRSNSYQSDPYSMGCPTFQLAARGDLASPTPNPEYDGLCTRSAFGAINGKASSAKWIGARKATIIAGPTHESLPPFSWTAEFANASHVGQPTTFDFEWIEVMPSM